MYSINLKVRYSESDENGKLSLTGLVNAFQDCAVEHSDSAGLTVAEMFRRKTVWVLDSWQILIYRMPSSGEEVRCVTNPHTFRGFTGSRNFVLETPEGERLSLANSLWTTINPDTGRPARMGEDIAEKYGVGECFEMPYAKRKILPEGEALPAPPPVQVGLHMLDTNRHLNNARYVSLAQDCLPPDFAYFQLRVQYRRPARLGDSIFPHVLRTEDRVFVSLDGRDGSPYALTEFSRFERA